MRAVPTTASRPEIAKGLDRFEKASRRLETLVDSMEPEEAILSEKLGKSILERLTALESQIAAPASPKADPALLALQHQIENLTTGLARMPDSAPMLSTLDKKLSQLAARPRAHD